MKLTALGSTTSGRPGPGAQGRWHLGSGCRSTWEKRKSWPKSPRRGATYTTSGWRHTRSPSAATRSAGTSSKWTQWTRSGMNPCVLMAALRWKSLLRNVKKFCMNVFSGHTWFPFGSSGVGSEHCCYVLTESFHLSHTLMFHSTVQELEVNVRIN